MFFTKSSDFGSSINCYIWHTGTGKTVQVCGGWPGKKATSLGNGNYKFVVPEDAKEIDDTWMIIWNDGSGNQTQDLKYKNQYLYTGNNKGSIQPTELVTDICEPTTGIENTTSKRGVRAFIRDGMIYMIVPQEGQKSAVRIYTLSGQLITTDASGILPEQ